MSLSRVLFCILMFAGLSGSSALALPDLAGLDLRPSGRPESYFHAQSEHLSWGYPFRLNLVVHNQGDADAGPFFAKIYLSPDSTIDASDHLLTPLNFSYGLPGGGWLYDWPDLQLNLPAVNPFGNSQSNFWIGMIVDSSNQVAESNESNNRNQGDGIDRDCVTIAGLVPILSVVDSVAPENDRLVPFGSVLNDGVGTQVATQTVTLRNVGTLPLVVSRNGLSLTGSSFFSISSVVSSTRGPVDVASTTNAMRTIAASQAEFWTVSVTFDPTVNGSFTNTLRILSNDPAAPEVAVGLSGEGVAAAALPDLAGVDLRPSGMPESYFHVQNEPLNWGYPFRLNLVVHNRGETDAGAFRGNIYLSTNGTIDASDYLIISLNFSSGLSGGGWKYDWPDLQLNLPTVNPFGNSQSNFWIGMIVDSSNQVAESNESNNSNLGDGIDLDAVTIVAPSPILSVADSVAPTNDRLVAFGPVLNDGAGAQVATQAVTLRNVGVLPLVVTRNGLSLAGSSAFSISSVVSSTRGPVNIASSTNAMRTMAASQAEYWTVTIKFDPDVNGALTNTLRIFSKDPAEPEVAVGLSGEGVVPIITLTAPTTNLTLYAGSPSLDLRWQDAYVLGNAAISLYLDADTNAAGGLIRIAGGLWEDEPANAYSWQASPVTTAGVYRVYAMISDGRVTNGSYAPGLVTLNMDARDAFRLRSPIVVTSPDYAYEYECNGRIYRGVTRLQSGDNVVTVSNLREAGGSTAVFQFTVRLAPSLLSTDTILRDELNRITKVRNGNGIETRLTYDWMNRLVRRESDNGAMVQFGYDVCGKRTNMTDAAGTTFYEWDDLDRLKAVIASKNGIKGDSDDRAMRYSYDLAGRETEVVYPGGERTQYAYDAAGRLVTVDNVTRALRFTYTYHPTSGLLTTLTRPNGIHTDFAYDGMGGLTNILHRRATGERVVNYAYTLDAAGKATEFRTTESDGARRVERYAYDRFDQLTQVIQSDDGVVDSHDKTMAFTYDGNGNRLAMTTRVNNAVVETRLYQYGNENRLLRVTDGAGTVLTEYYYDAAGNLIQETAATRTRIFRYDERNLLIGVSDGTNQIAYAYDGDGNRIGRTVNGRRRVFVNDINRPLGETVQELDESGAVAVAFTLGDRRLATSRTDDEFGLTDRLGSVRLAVSSAGATRYACGYEAFGATIPLTGTPGDYAFAGERVDLETGFIYLRARYYAPDTGRFTSKDPLGVSAGLNAYIYCGADPINNVDPTGTVDWRAAADAALGITGNSLKAAAAAWVIFSPDPVSVGVKVGAGVAAILAGYGILANGVNLDAAFNDLPPPSSGSLLNDVGGVVLPGNQDLQTALTIFQTGMDGRSLLISGSSGSALTLTQKALDLFPTATPPPSFFSPIPSGVAGSVPNTSWYSDPLYGLDTAPRVYLPAERSPTPIFPRQEQIPFYDYRAGDPINLNELNPYYQDQIMNTGPGIWTPEAANQEEEDEFGGVLIDKAAQLIGANLSDIRGAIYDPITGQFVFLGTANTAQVKDINLDYLFTALQSVYGSIYSPPSFSLDWPAFPHTVWSDHGDGDGILEPGEEGGFVVRYYPTWSQVDTTVDVRLYLNTSEVRARFNCIPQNIGCMWGPAMKMVFQSWVSAPPAGVTLDMTPWQNNDWTGCDLTLKDFPYLNEMGQDCYIPFNLRNQTDGSRFSIKSEAVVPARIHGEFGGRTEGSRLGWVMMEADRVLKSLGSGRDNLLTNIIYSSATVPVTGFQSLLERLAASNQPGTWNQNNRMTLIANEMTLKRHVDPETGRISILFDKASVMLETESSLQEYRAFAAHFTENYDAFAALSFPCYDPDDPASTNIVHVKIYELLREVMQSVALARFFHDNQVPVDMWWLNGWTPPKAYSPRTVANTSNQMMGSGGSIVTIISGGTSFHLTNTYVSSATAGNVADAMQVSRPEQAGSGDIKAQIWTNHTEVGALTAVAVQMAAEPQDGSIRLAETDLSIASPGAMPLHFTRYYHGSRLSDAKMGPGWRSTSFALEFERPSWFDENGVFATDEPQWIDSVHDTRLRSGAVRVVDLRSGRTLDFTSSLVISYLDDGRIGIGGMTTNNLPTFEPGIRRNGSTLVQCWPACDYVLTTPDGMTITFDHEGRLLQTRDRYAKTQTYQYNPQGVLTNIADSAGRSLSLAYDTSFNKLLRVTGPAGEQVVYDYATNGCLVSVRHLRSGATTTYTYNPDRQLLKKTRFNGLIAGQCTPDLKGRAALGVDLRSNTLSSAFTQNADGTIRTTEIRDPLMTDPDLQPVRKQFDRKGRLLRARSVTGAEVMYGYDSESLLPNTVTLPMAGRPPVVIERNEYGQPTCISDPGNTGAQDVTASYDPTSGQLRQISDPAGRIVEFAYNENRNVARVRNHLGAQNVDVCFAYTASGALSALTNELGVRSVMIHRDALDRATNAVDAAGISIQCQYDTLGRLWKMYDPRMSGPIEYIYDNFDRVIEIRCPAGSVFREYDSAKGWLVRQTDILGRSTHYVRAQDTGDILQVVDEVPGGVDRVTTMTYTRWGTLATVQPSGGSWISFNYDQAGRPLGSAELDACPPGSPKALSSNHALDGIPTSEVNHVFTWGAPASDSGIAGYSYAFDGTPGNTTNTIASTAVWNNVPFGSHTLRVKALGNNGLWGSEATFHLVVESLSSYALWRTRVFNPSEVANDSISGPTADPDHDGMNNLEEYTADTNPKDDRSTLAITGITFNQNAIAISWMGGTSVWQYLEGRHNMLSTAEQWSAFFTNAPPTPSTNTLMWPLGTNRHGFFRIRASR